MYLGVSKTFYLFALASVIILVAFPQIDLYISALFYTNQEGFFWGRHPIVLFFYSIPRVIVIVALIGLILLIIDMITRKRLFSLRPLLLFYFSAVMIVGPGIIVHNIFKDNWGRARPVQTHYFGGTKEFTPAWVISDQCQSNCSFVSGHSGGAFGLIALALLLKRRRNLAMITAISIGSLVGLGRIIQGGHFFSDVFFSFIIVFLTAKILYYFIFEKEYFNFIDRRSLA